MASYWWKTQKTIPARVVRALGGPSKAARALKVSPCTITFWRTIKSVPQRHWAYLLKHKVAGVTLKDLAGL
jgi:hypothetical protein